MRWRTEDDRPLRKTTTTAATPRTLHTSPTVARPGKQIVRIEWDSAEGQMQGFRQCANFKPFLEAIGPFYDDIEEMKHYQVMATG
jgi:hypothetical protein